MANENIGELGRAFIAQRTNIGSDFDQAWAEWTDLSSRLHFMLVDCPEVRYYDDRRVTDRSERLHIRELAQERIGLHILSSDVSLLAKVAEGLNVTKPVRPNHVDREAIRELFAWVADRLEADEGYTEDCAMARNASVDEDHIEAWARDLEAFAEKGGLQDTPLESVVVLYFKQNPSEK